MAGPEGLFLEIASENCWGKVLMTNELRKLLR